ncbi:hypothetical protein F2Q70_00031239 [Brassica cretica]|uniref:Uncharacterized protein n=1 Tax=Brassica cretica TaxID=69181 RepID=A0A8S9FI37_BRACR|nr:hypothetical protein F2Q70_00031239 [Brassica cretica]
MTEQLRQVFSAVCKPHLPNEYRLNRVDLRLLNNITKATAAFHAILKGITVVCSGGNSCPAAQTLGNVALWIVTMAATALHRSFPTHLLVATELSRTSTNGYNPNPCILVCSSILAPIANLALRAFRQLSVFVISSCDSTRFCSLRLLELGISPTALIAEASTLL